MAEEIIRWKKIGGGPLYLQNRIIKPGQVFRARPSEISKAFRDTVIPLEDIPEEKPVVIDVKPSNYSIKPRGKSKTWFDVIDAQEKVVNEKALTKEQAQKLARDLS